MKPEVITTSKEVTIKEEKKAIQIKPLKMTMQETEDLLGRGKIKTVVKEDNSQLRYTKTEELVIVGSEPLMSDTYTSDESYGDYSEPETSEA